MLSQFAFNVSEFSCPSLRLIKSRTRSPHYRARAQKGMRMHKREIITNHGTPLVELTSWTTT